MKLILIKSKIILGLVLIGFFLLLPHQPLAGMHKFETTKQTTTDSKDSKEELAYSFQPKKSK